MIYPFTPACAERHCEPLAAWQFSVLSGLLRACSPRNDEIEQLAQIGMSLPFLISGMLAHVWRIVITRAIARSNLGKVNGLFHVERDFVLGIVIKEFEV